MESEYATVTPDTKIELLQNVLADARAAIVIDRDAVVGILTKIDLIEFLSKKSAEALSVPKPKALKAGKNGAKNGAKNGKSKKPARNGAARV